MNDEENIKNEENLEIKDDSIESEVLDDVSFVEIKKI